MDTTAHRRFEAKRKVLGPDECWPWTGGRSRSGYGSFTFDGVRSTPHRFAFIEVNGYAPPHVMHRCNNKICTNPAHLVAGNARLNAIHAVHAGMIRVKKIAIEMVPTIRELISMGVPTKAIAGVYGVSPSMITKIGNHRRWGHVGTSILDGIMMPPEWRMAA